MSKKTEKRNRTGQCDLLNSRLVMRSFYEDPHISAYKSMHLEKYKKMPFCFNGEDDTKVTFTLVNLCLGGILSRP